MRSTNCVITVSLGLICGIYGSISRVDPLVETKVGLIRGLNAPDGEYFMFLGIPYATVDPSNPFGPSIPHEGFDDTFNAYDDAAMCPQRDAFNNTVVGSLDCLHLNVYVPRTASSRNRLPVLVWIHGGGFNTAFGGRLTHGPKFLVRHDVIVVILNYRLGAYGFFCLDTPGVPGNQGLKDQLEALRWIKSNIEAFGGDSDRVTIAGESAGGISVDIHLIYNQEKLFNNVIIQSGTSLSPSGIVNSDPSAPLKLAENLGFVTNDLEEALGFLKTVDTSLVVAATPETDIVLKPCVEQKFENVERLITDHPNHANIPNAKIVSVLIGFNNNENNFGHAENEVVNPFAILKDYYEYDNQEHLDNFVDNVRRFYIGGEDASGEVKDQIANFLSDFGFLNPSYRSMENYFENGANSIYHYMFSYEGNRNLLKRMLNVTASGAIHADELGYLFDVAMFDELPTPEDQLTIDRITTLWTNFAKYSNPTPEVTPILPVQWPAVTSEARFCLNIDSEISVIKRPFHERMAFWDMLHKWNRAISQTKQKN